MARLARNATRYIVRGDFDGFTARVRARKQDSSIGAIQSASTKPSEVRWGIMSTPHTLFIAQLIADRLREHGWKVDIVTDPLEDFFHNWYVVICPQMFKKIPPGEKRIVFQMEQSVSSRWINKNYIKILENSLAMFEYSLCNIEFFAQKGIAYPHVHYLPIGASANYGKPLLFGEKKFDVLFYGDFKSSSRRRKMLKALTQQFNVRVVSEVFGHDMLSVIRQARVVVNLHYYENALLEMPRIQECLSLGIPVISEASQDQDDYPELAGAVRFFEAGSIPAMLDMVKASLIDPVSPETIKLSVSLSAERFAFMFDRFLVSMGFLPASHVSHMNLPLPNEVDLVAISLPETIARRRIFETESPCGCSVFEGIRRRPGWVGCGLSYSALAQHAIRQGKSSLNIMEDDVLFPPDFEDKMAIVHDFLNARVGKWDIFSGLIASLHPDTKILSTEVYKGITFVIIDKMTSMVFNIYNEKALRLLAAWDPENLDPTTNTIDRFLEGQSSLRVVVALPFLVGHRENVYSTLWGFQNTQYRDMIACSEKKLQLMLMMQQHDDITN